MCIYEHEYYRRSSPAYFRGSILYASSITHRDAHHACVHPHLDMSAYTVLYKKTLVFAFILTIMSIVLLWMVLAIPAISGVKTFIVILELGIMVVIIAMLIRVKNFEKKGYARMTNNVKTLLPVTTCPDYYSIQYDTSGKAICRNKYMVPDTDITYKFVSPTGMTTIPQEIPMDNYKDKTVREVCTALDPSIADNSGMYDIPWTNIRSQCRSVINTGAS